MKYILLVSSISYLCSCASVQRSTILGAALGGVSIGAAGSMIAGDQHRERGVVVGSVIGATLGGVIGYLAYKSKDRNDVEKAASLNPLSPNTPLLTSPKVRRVWVPAKIEGEKYIDGHYMFVIEKTSGWSN